MGSRSEACHCSAQETESRHTGEQFEYPVGILEVIKEAEAQCKTAAADRHAEVTVEVQIFNPHRGIERRLYRRHSLHAVVVGRGVIDRANTGAERFEKEGKV